MARVLISAVLAILSCRTLLSLLLIEFIFAEILMILLLLQGHWVVWWDNLLRHWTRGILKCFALTLNCLNWRARILPLQLIPLEIYWRLSIHKLVLICYELALNMLHILVRIPCSPAFLSNLNFAPCLLFWTSNSRVSLLLVLLIHVLISLIAASLISWLLYCCLVYYSILKCFLSRQLPILAPLSLVLLF